MGDRSGHPEMWHLHLLLVLGTRPVEGRPSCMALGRTSDLAEKEVEELLLVSVSPSFPRLSLTE